MPEKRMLEVLLHGAHERTEVREGIAAALGKPSEQFVFIPDPEEIIHFGYDVLIRADGFRTQVTLVFDPAEDSCASTDLEFARLLAHQFKDDALVLDDPTRPGEEPFHGLLARPNGSAFRVPLEEIEPEGMDIDPDPAHWTEWRG